MTVCRHSVLNKRATNKSSVRNKATNKIGRGRKRAKAGDQSQKLSGFRMLTRLLDFVNLRWKIERGSRLFNITAGVKAWGELPSLLVPCISSALLRRGLHTSNLAVG
jgi:hypothetical protein